MKYSDRPISNPAEDYLRRSEFAYALAGSIDELKVARDGFVIGILGEWGAGKSSVVELILHYLKTRDIERIAAVRGSDLAPRDLDFMRESYQKVEPTIEDYKAVNLDLNYWQASHRIDTFFRKCGSENEAEAALEYWSLLEERDRAARNIVVRFSPWLIAGRVELAGALLIDIARTAGEKLTDEVRDAFAGFLNRLSQLAPLAGAAVNVATQSNFGGMVSAGLGLSGIAAKRLTQGPTLDEVRERLRAALAKLQGQKVLVVVDDLDRLTPQEAVEMLALIKGICDLPNVVYLLCYDEPRLAELIHTHLDVDGSKFLEKIVQYPVRLPLLDATDLSRLFFGDMQALLPSATSQQLRRLNDAWVFFVRKYMKTPRNVRRLVNAFSVSLAGLEDYTDPIDLLAIEVLRLNEPKLYEWIRTSLDEVVD